MSVTWERTREPGVYKRAGARGTHYRVMVRDASGRQIVRNFDRFEDAKDHRRKATGEDRPADSRDARRTLAEVYEAQHRARSYAPGTLVLHRAAWHHLEQMADVPIGKISPADVDRVLAAIGKPVMRERTRALLSVTFNYAIEKRWATRNPVTRPRRRRTRAEMLDQRPKRAMGDETEGLTSEEVRRLINAMPEKYRAMIEVMSALGLRPGEAHGLTRRKYTPATDVPERRPARLRVDASIGGPTKTGIGRVLTVPPSVAEILEEHLARFTPEDEDARMFGDVDDDNFRKRTFAAAVKAAGITKGVSPNSLRHYAATFQIAHGADIYSVMTMLGHSTPAVTLNVYGSLFRERHEKWIGEYDQAIRAARAGVSG